MTTRLSKKYGLIKLRSKIPATKTIDEAMNFCLKLIFLDAANFAPFHYFPESSLDLSYTY
jgi:hypothetical protein